LTLLELPHQYFLEIIRIFWKFHQVLLQNKAGWKERQEVSGDEANPLAVIMQRIAESAHDPLDYHKQ
jgi:hypothetical protein